MLRVTVLRAFSISALGLIVFWGILFASGIGSKVQLRKNKKKARVDLGVSKTRIIIIYLLALFGGFILLYLLI